MDGQVRLATPDDAPAIRSIFAPAVESTAVSFEVDPPSTDSMRRRIEKTLQTHPWLVYESGTDVVGYAAASALRPYPAYDWSVELSIYVAEVAHRSGVGTALYDALFDVLSLQGFVHAYAVTTLPNPASTRFHERMGFEPVGTFPAVGYKLGEWHDIRWWRRELVTPPANPEAPRPLDALRGDDRLRAVLRSPGDD